MPETTADALSPNAAFEILGNSRRRRVLYYLAEADGEASLSDIAMNIAADEQEITRSEVTDSQRRQVFIPLYQMHIPRLEEAGIVEYDDDEGLVRLINEDALTHPLGRKTPRPTRWYRYYIGWSLLGVIAVVAAWYGLLPEARGLWTILALILVSGMLLLAGLQYWSQVRQ